MKKDYPDYELRPITLRTAQGFVDENHRHNKAPQGHKFSIGLWADDRLIGVAIVGRPIAKANDDGLTAELTRCCVIEHQPNANSLLYAAAWRAAKGMGYKRMITYTLPSESGVSLKAAGFIVSGQTKPSPQGWNVPSRPRSMPEKYPKGEKIRWEISRR
jgi:hypothetical protein